MIRSNDEGRGTAITQATVSLRLARRLNFAEGQRSDAICEGIGSRAFALPGVLRICAPTFYHAFRDDLPGWQMMSLVLSCVIPDRTRRPPPRCLAWLRPRMMSHMRCDFRYTHLDTRMSISASPS